MPIVSRKTSTTISVLFSEREVEIFRQNELLRKGGLPRDHWAQIDLSPSGVFLNVVPHGVTGHALDLLVDRARREVHRS